MLLQMTIRKQGHSMHDKEGGGGSVISNHDQKIILGVGFSQNQISMLLQMTIRKQGHSMHDKEGGGGSVISNHDQKIILGVGVLGSFIDPWSSSLFLLFKGRSFLLLETCVARHHIDIDGAG